MLAGAGTPAQLHACKLLFKLSKLEANDGDFRAAGTLSLLLATTRRARGRAPLALDAALYAAGALKNVSADGANQRALAKESVVAALAPLLRPSSWADAAGGAATSGDGDDGVAALPPRAVQLLVLTTATQRNVAVSGAVPQFRGARSAESRERPPYRRATVTSWSRDPRLWQSRFRASRGSRQR